jgi:beta-glucosidase
VFTGHRWYDARKIKPRFAFGHGLSYTRFHYDGLAIDAEGIAEDGVVEITVMVHNIGERAGKEVVQVYVGECSPRVPRPVRELKAFQKVALAPGEEKPLQFQLNWRDFARYDTMANDWVMNAGEFEVSIGSSSANILLSARVTLESAHDFTPRVDGMTPFAAAVAHPVAGVHMQPIVDAIDQRFGTGEGSEMMKLFMSDTPISKFVIMGLLTQDQLDHMIAASNA